MYISFGFSPLLLPVYYFLQAKLAKCVGVPTRYGDAIDKLMVGTQRVCTGTTCDYSMRYVNLYSSCSINIVSQTVSGNFSSQYIQT